MKRWHSVLLLVSLGVADFLGAIDSTSVTVALPTISRDLHIGLSLLQWIPSAYILVLTCSLLFIGRLGDRIGVKKMYVVGLGLFGAASLALGFINSVPLLIAFRAVQGLGTAILYTMPMAIIRTIWHERSEKAFAVTSSMFAAGMIVGPVIGGVLASQMVFGVSGWHYIFLINVPFVVLGILAVQKVVPRIDPQRTPLGSMPNAAVLLASLGATVYALAAAQWIWVVPGILLFVLFMYLEALATHPVVPLTLFKNVTFSAANLISFTTMVSVIGISIILSFYLQDVRGYSPIQTAIAVLPVSLSTIIFSFAASALRSWRVGGFMCAVLIFLGMCMLQGISSDSSYYVTVLPAVILLGAGSSFLMTTLFSAILGSADVQHAGSASGILNTIQNLASLISIAVVTPMVHNYQLALGILLVVSVLGIIPAFWIRTHA